MKERWAEFSVRMIFIVAFFFLFVARDHDISPETNIHSVYSSQVQTTYDRFVILTFGRRAFFDTIINGDYAGERIAPLRHSCSGCCRLLFNIAHCYDCKFNKFYICVKSRIRILFCFLSSAVCFYVNACTHIKLY